jgi:hypothetical protein
MRPKKTLAFVLTVAAFAVAAPAALAAERHVSPAGAGTACSAAAPCSIEEAFAGAASGDEIVLAAGDYGSPSSRLTSQLFDNWKTLDVHGQPGAARPRIWSEAEGGSVVLLSPDSRLAYVDIDNSRADAPALWGNLGSIDHVRIESKGLGISLSNGSNASITVANTSVHTSVEGGWGLSVSHVRALPDFALGLTLRNVTIVADGVGSPAISLASIGVNGAKMDLTASVFNSILRGTDGDIAAQASGAGDRVTVVLDHSNFAGAKTYGSGASSVSAANENSNQSSAPAFVNAAAGDLRQAVGSPTIDAGASDPLAGATDLEGDPRVVGDAADIGSDEYVPAPPPPVGDGGSGAGDGPAPRDGSGGAGDATPPADVAAPTPAVPAGGSTGTPRPRAACVVPRLTGKTLSAARAALAKAGCATGKVTRKRSSRKAGKVIAQKAKAGARLKAGTKIALVIGRR